MSVRVGVASSRQLRCLWASNMRSLGSSVCANHSRAGMRLHEGSTSAVVLPRRAASAATTRQASKVPQTLLGVPRSLFSSQRLLMPFRGMSAVALMGGPSLDQGATHTAKRLLSTETHSGKEGDAHGPSSTEAEDAADAPVSEKEVLEQPTGEVGGPKGKEPTRYGDWERKGRVSDF